MSLIYEPKGPAREYAARACNLYKGCGHNCLYCYAPYFAYQCTKPEVAKEKFKNPTIKGKETHTEEEKVEVILKKLKREAEKYNEPHRVLMSFTSDVYQPREAQDLLTQRAIKILGEAEVPLAILTKSEMVLRDIDLFKKYDIEFATTICFLDEEMRKKYEPDASPINARLRALAEMKKIGVRTWVSLEPTIDVDEALGVIKELIGQTDLIKVGTVDERWDPDLYKSIDWTGYLAKALKLLHGNIPYYIKNGLWKYANDEIKNNYPKEG